MRDGRFYLDVAVGGSVGAGESFMAGRWTTDGLVALVRILVRNNSVLQGLEGGLARLSAPVLRLAHRLRDNSLDRSRDNIARALRTSANDFYRLFLDPTLSYSCAVFERPDQDLEAAQLAKIDRICRKLDLGNGDHLLEIGTGWGALAVHAATRYGCRVTTTTLSRAQHEVALERVRAAGVADRVEVLLQDYRELEGTYDKLVSVEMIEAVGERWFDAYFRRCSDLLAPEGTMLLQAITIQDQHYEEALRSVDFIQRHVFPGSCIPSVGAIADRVTRVTDLRIVHLEDLTPHYARTLQLWREQLLANGDAVRGLGYSETFLRLLEFYLAYCEGGYRERSVGNVQVLLDKPLVRRAAPLGALA